MRRRIAVCDDEKVMLRQLSQYLNQVQEETGDRYDLFYYTSAEELLDHLPKDVQVILLDISMGDMSGMECARALRERGCEAAVFFITSMTEYALEGYEVHAYAFLPKPLIYSELKGRLTDYFSRMDRNRKAILPVETAGGMELLPIEDILYAEVYQHELSFTLRDRAVTGILQLSQVAERLEPHGFFRCHRSYLVNMAQIRRIDPDTITMQNGAAVPVSKHRRKTFLDAFSNYMGGRFA